ncbi:hypothetical protein [Streptomyces sp. SID12488]|uniref:hypothetical protein n=1 Tax=Streptomyces sp. SID12488 TaxID=2706040 RepID=UPI0013D913D1|nr:hypothetical protein [Streptomyces sp. SID12488]NEA61200.1 hypothetical protein [Streptomyces sp. SID12488]
MTLVGVCQRIAHFGKRVPIGCRICNYSGPAKLTAVYWKPGHKHDDDGWSVACVGCISDSGIHVFLPIPEGARIAEARKPYEIDPIILV